MLTKILATLGPATDTPEIIKTLVEAGVDVFRLNASHGTQEEHGRRIRIVRQVADEMGAHIGLLLDLQGPKIRLERFADGPVKLKKGQQWTITTRDVPGDAVECGTTYKDLPGDVHAGEALRIHGLSCHEDLVGLDPGDRFEEPLDVLAIGDDRLDSAIDVMGRSLR